MRYNCIEKEARPEKNSLTTENAELKKTETELDRILQDFVTSNRKFLELNDKLYYLIIELKRKLGIAEDCAKKVEEKCAGDFSLDACLKDLSNCVGELSEQIKQLSSLV